MLKNFELLQTIHAFLFNVSNKLQIKTSYKSKIFWTWHFSSPASSERSTDCAAKSGNTRAPKESLRNPSSFWSFPREDNTETLWHQPGTVRIPINDKTVTKFPKIIFRFQHNSSMNYHNHSGMDKKLNKLIQYRVPNAS